ncbi:hypothetical protein K378_01470 [Streptomyces sp. Amel2xB2]|uniref:hypothetical protein n=1 Tax=Streptomyces sp. Amel2xB2 TaxID=1305829 RepID=UPI000DB9B8E5|nr:hypothetical protein [Streptomyces sp. Amel2xB2]RAJ70305.1 hypothetical protein K378_01470 [Streptomyces sp. Amel2xB2]
MLRRPAIVAAAIAATVALTATQASAVTVTTVGSGWKVFTAKNVTSIKPSQQYTVTFESTATKNLTAKYLAQAVPQINAAGVKLTVGGVETVAAGKCAPRGHIHVTRVYQPLGKKGFSRALPCYDTTDNSAFGGIVQMDSEYYDGRNTLPTANMWNVHVHEMLHVLGLDHPNVDLNRDGTVADYECVQTSYKNKPLMCSPSGGYKTATNQGKLLAYDINGLKALLANAKVQGIK